ncbi:MAG: hypothetical protein O3A95_01860 [Planctomycetota bacterium]|nr:hypothetical protein [Planctomycetota bacterium]MDA1113029.1 hypothetical protein [Planctomycetota bacterium]
MHTPFSKLALGAAVLLILSTSSTLLAQEGQLSDPTDALEGRMLESTFPGHMGRGGSGFTSRFDASFNPAIGLIFDGLGTFSEEAGEGVDQFDLRSVELNMASRIDPLGWAYIVAAFEGDEFELEEAVIMMDQLPANMTLRVGKMLADFGKWNTIHLHDKNYVFEDGVRTAFFGGNLNATGVELHQWTGIGNLPIRWSLGVHSDFGGEGDFASEIIGNRGLEELGFTGRVTTQQDYGANGFLQYGFSFFHTSEGLAYLRDSDADGITDEEFGLGQTTFALDFTLRDVDASDNTANTLSLELWRNQRDSLDAADNIISSDANGIWGFYQHDFNPFWGAGVQLAWWQDPLNTTGSDWFTSAESGGQRAAFVTHNLSEFNRIRMQLSQDHNVLEDPTWTLAFQWDVILGSHSHSLDW